MQREHPGVGIQMSGRQREMKKAFSTLPIGFTAACIMIYIILAWLFGSYLQPVAVMLRLIQGATVLIFRECRESETATQTETFW